MTSRRLLSDLLTEVAIGTLDALAGAPGMIVREVSVVLPVEVALERRRDEIQLVGDLPRTVTRSVFDTEPGRMHVLWREEAW